MSNMHVKVTRKSLFVGLAVVIAIVAAVGVGALLRQWQQASPKNTTHSHTKEDEEAIKKAAQLPGAAEEAQTLRLKGDQAAAEKKINEALSNPSASKEERFQLYVQLGFIYDSNKKYVEAIDAYKKASAIQEATDIYMLMGDASVVLGDKPQAVVFYKKAISVIPQNHPQRIGTKERLETKIKDAGGQL